MGYYALPLQDVAPGWVLQGILEEDPDEVWVSTPPKAACSCIVYVYMGPKGVTIS